MRELILIKLGGSLITDKRRPGTERPEALAGASAEVAEIAAGRVGGVIVGHGSGSFGHAAASRYDLRGELSGERQIDGVAVTRARAMRLDQLVVEALLESGARPFAYPPSSWMVAERGEPGRIDPEPLLHGLDLGLLPVVYGDVVMDTVRGATICSTETIFLALARSLPSRGARCTKVFWLGETEGIYDASGRTVPEVCAADPGRVLAAVGRAAGADVTGGMRHRLDSALALARLGVASWIGDGRRRGALSEALEGASEGGTWVRPEPG